MTCLQTGKKMLFKINVFVMMISIVVSRSQMKDMKTRSSELITKINDKNEIIIFRFF